MRYRVNCIIISLLAGLVILALVINVLEIRELKRSLNNRPLESASYSLTSKPTDMHVTSTRNAWIYPENVSDITSLMWSRVLIIQKQHLRHVAMVLQRLGYRLHSDQWQIMWSHDYPFTSHRALIMNLKPHQKVHRFMRSHDYCDVTQINHFAGTGYFTNKASLAGTKFPFMPRSYRLPQEAALFRKEV